MTELFQSQSVLTVGVTMTRHAASKAFRSLSCWCCAAGSCGGHCSCNDRFLTVQLAPTSSKASKCSCNIDYLMQSTIRWCV
jgi:hypothetical protein